jgi:hypothetical protein
VASLLPRLAEADPALIAVDLAFLRDSCKPDLKQNWTDQLKSSLESVSQRVPVLVGQSAVDLKQLTEEVQHGLVEHGMHQNGLILKPVVELPGPATVQVGLIRVNRDLRRIPLEWPVYQRDHDAVEYRGMAPSLALQAARMQRAEFPDGLEAINDFVKTGIHKKVCQRNRRRSPVRHRPY